MWLRRRTISSGRSNTPQPVRRRRVDARQPRTVDHVVRSNPAAGRGAIPALGSDVPQLRCPHPGGPVPRVARPRRPRLIAPLFLLYDYTFRPPGATTKKEGLDVAYETGVVCTDEALLFFDPYPSREAWCEARVQVSEARLAAIDSGFPTVLVTHFPLTREPTSVLAYPSSPSGAVPSGPPTAPAVPRSRGRLRPLAHSRQQPAGRSAVRGSVPRLPRRTGTTRRPPAPADADSPGRSHRALGALR